MTIPRMVGLLLALTTIGIAVVVIRVDQVRTSQRIQTLRFQETQLQREIWTQEMELARLRSPRLIRERAEQLNLNVALPKPTSTAPARTAVAAGGGIHD